MKFFFVQAEAAPVSDSIYRVKEKKVQKLLAITYLFPTKLKKYKSYIICNKTIWDKT